MPESATVVLPIRKCAYLDFGTPSDICTNCYSSYSELQVGKFMLTDGKSGHPGAGQHIEGDPTPTQVPVHLRFPDIFLGKGVRGHRYHVFDKPQYFYYPESRENKA